MKFVYKQTYHSTYIGNKVSKNKLIILISWCFMIYIFSSADIIGQPHLHWYCFSICSNMKTLFLRAVKYPAFVTNTYKCLITTFERSFQNVCMSVNTSISKCSTSWIQYMLSSILKLAFLSSPLPIIGTKLYTSFQERREDNYVYYQWSIPSCRGYLRINLQHVARLMER